MAITENQEISNNKFATDFMDINIQDVRTILTEHSCYFPVHSSFITHPKPKHKLIAGTRIRGLRINAAAVVSHISTPNS